jgi:hypothetical protein
VINFGQNDNKKVEKTLWFFSSPKKHLDWHLALIRSSNPSWTKLAITLGASRLRTAQAMNIKKDCIIVDDRRKKSHIS